MHSWKGYVYTVFLLMAVILQTLCFVNSNFTNIRLGMNIRAGLSAMLYRKVGRPKPAYVNPNRFFPSLVLTSEVVAGSQSVQYVAASLCSGQRDDDADGGYAAHHRLFLFPALRLDHPGQVGAPSLYRQELSTVFC